jgi:isoleucyl-tRNA synthetase
MIPAADEQQKSYIEAVSHLILNEVNVKKLQFVDNTTGILVKRIKPDFKKLGPKCGKLMKQVATMLSEMPQKSILDFEKTSVCTLQLGGQAVVVDISDVEILSEDIPGWLVANDGRLTVALDITLTDALRNEGLARELVNRIQNMRKSNGFEISDRIKIQITDNEEIKRTVDQWKHYIMSQTLADNIELTDNVHDGIALDFDEMDLMMSVKKV